VIAALGVVDASGQSAARRRARGSYSLHRIFVAAQISGQTW